MKYDITEHQLVDWDGATAIVEFVSGSLVILEVLDGPEAGTKLWTSEDEIAMYNPDLVELQ